MIYEGRNIRVRLLENGLAEMVFDLQGESVNKFDVQTMLELGEAGKALVAMPGVTGLLITSAKDAFIVGADITQFNTLFREPESVLAERVVEIGAAFNAVEDFPFPVVVAINGAAMGGGLELALCGDYRIAASDAVLGLPEVKLGINPGFGGTVRLPRVIGIDNAVEWICMGKDNKADAALVAGVVDAVVAPERLRQSALEVLSQSVAGDLDYRARRGDKTGPVKLNDVEKMMAFTTAKAVVAGAAGPHMKAPMAAVRSIEKSCGLARAEALKIEATTFAQLAKTDVSRALIGLFMNEQSVSRRAKEASAQARPVARGAVLGAGIMGGGIAYQSAFKGVPVLMKDIAEQGLQLGMGEASKLLSAQVAKGRMAPERMGQVLASIRPTLDFQGFDQVDVVVEAVVENPRVKQAVLAETETHLRPDVVLASNTSTISITSLAGALKRPENFCGMHFFNPVHRMPLVEVIRGRQSSDMAVATVVAYARAMGKTPIVVNDCPGFFVNRVLFPYFGGFMKLLKEGADFRQVDRVMEHFGWPMGPAYLLDVVGIDTAHHAGSTMAEGFPERMKESFRTALDVLFEHKRLGQKTGAGFYRYGTDSKGKPRKDVDEVVFALLKDVTGTPREFSEEEIVQRLMIPMCIEAVRCLEEGIVGSAGDADLGLIMGIGFPMFRGGALRYLDTLGLATFCEQADRHASLGPLYQPTARMREMAARGETFFG